MKLSAMAMSSAGKQKVGPCFVAHLLLLLRHNHHPTRPRQAVVSTVGRIPQTLYLRSTYLRRTHRRSLAQIGAQVLDMAY